MFGTILVTGAFNHFATSEMIHYLLFEYETSIKMEIALHSALKVPNGIRLFSPNRASNIPVCFPQSKLPYPVLI